MRFPPLILLTLVILNGCSSPPATDYTYTPPANPAARMCTMQCNEARNYCQQSCTLDNRACIKDVQTQALKDYDDYTRRQFAAGAVIEFRLRDFERDKPCDDKKKSCLNDCEKPYASCYKECGGAVDLKDSCSFLCF